MKIKTFKKMLSVKIDGKTISTKRLAEHLVEHQMCNEFKASDYLLELEEEIKECLGRNDGGECGFSDSCGM